MRTEPTTPPPAELSSAVFPYLPLTHSPRSADDPYPWVDIDGHRPARPFRIPTVSLDDVERDCARRYLDPARQANRDAAARARSASDRLARELRRPGGRDGR